jgi:hypothetical protein
MLSIMYGFNRLHKMPTVENFSNKGRKNAPNWFDAFTLKKKRSNTITRESCSGAIPVTLRCIPWTAAISDWVTSCVTSTTRRNTRSKTPFDLVIQRITKINSHHRFSLNWKFHIWYFLLVYIILLFIRQLSPSVGFARRVTRRASFVMSCPFSMNLHRTVA